MPRNEEGEFELVVGNRQLLSGFFIVVVLFGVFFTMGYIVGRHSSPPPLTSAAAETTPTRQPSSTAPAPGRAEVVEAEPPKAETPKAETPPPENPRSATKPATAPAESPRPPPTPRAVSSEMPGPPPGRYWQVAAPRRTAADAVVESLRNKGITAVLAPGPNEDTVRVLVGPVDAANVGKVRSDLESAGFRPFLKNY